MKKALGIIAILLVIAVGGFVVFQRIQAKRSAQSAQVSLETVALERGVLETTISATGNVRSKQTSVLTWQTSGIVEAVNARLGSKVKKGEVLASLAVTSLPQSVITAQSDLFTAQKALEDLTTSANDARIQAMNDVVTYEQAVRDSQYTLDNFTIPTNQKGLDTVEALKVMKERLDNVRASFEPYKYLPADNETRKNLKTTLDQAQSDYNAAVKRLQYEYDLEVAQSNLLKAQQAYEKWRNGPDPAEVDSVRAKIAAAEAALKQRTIEAPFDGTITEAAVIPGDKAASGVEAFRIDDLTALFVDLKVNEVDIDQISIGQSVSVTLDALRGSVYPGSVVDVAMVSEASDSAVNYLVTVALNEIDAKVRPGMTAEVDILTSQGRQALLIPNQAIRTENEQQIVYVLKAGQKAVPVPVTLGASSDTYSELLTGALNVGDLVVLNPPENSQQSTRRNLLFFGHGGGPPSGIGGGSRPRDGQSGSQRP